MQNDTQIPSFVRQSYCYNCMSMSCLMQRILSACFITGEARPSIDFEARASFGSYIVNGVEAIPGEFPWQLSQQRLGATWSHICGASLLSSNYVLSAAHCVEGA